MAESDKAPVVNSVVSLPLYASALVITLCGTFAANAALTVPDPSWIVRTTLLTLLGFAFSYGCRRLQVPSRQIEAAFLALILLAVAAFVTGMVDFTQFLPNGADRPDLRLVSLLAWSATLWSWALLTDNRLLLAPVLAMATLGLAATLDLNAPVVVCFGVFIVAVIFLLIHQNYLLNLARATASEQVRPPAAMLLAQAVQTVVCAVGVLLVGMIVIVPAQAGFSRLSLGGAIRQLANLGKGNFAGVNGSILHYADGDNFSIGTGEGWSSSPEVVMHVSPSDGQEHLWRGRTYDSYTGDGWQSSLENALEPLPTLGSANQPSFYAVPLDFTPGDRQVRPTLAGPRTIAERVLPIGESQQFYYTGTPSRIALGQRDFDARHGNLEACHDGRLDLDSHNAFHEQYAVLSILPLDPNQPTDQARLRQAGKEYPAIVRQLYLGDLHNTITDDDDVAFFQQMLAAAVQDLPVNRHDPLDQALAIRDWVSQRCVYSLAVPPMTPNSDHVHEFLGTTRQGYCDMFASSMAVLCRTAGIPVRVCTGFAPGIQDPTGFNLRGEDKHAWVEVYFPHFGWVPFDPTAGSRTDGSVPGATAPAQPFGWLHWGHQSRLQKVVPIGIIVAILLLVAYVLKTEVFDRRRALRHLSTPREKEEQVRIAHRTLLGRHYARMTRLLASIGLARRISETPDAYAARVLPLLKAQSVRTGVFPDPLLITILTQEFVLACYSSADVAALNAEKWKQPLSEFAAAVRHIRWKQFWQRWPPGLVKARGTLWDH